MKLTGLLLLLCFFANGVWAQDEAVETYKEGSEALKAREYKKAEKAYTRAIELAEDDRVRKMSYIFRGQARNGQSKFDEAIADFTVAVRLDSSDAATYADRAKTYAYMRDYKNAVADFNRVLAIDSSDQQAQAAYYYLGKIYFSSVDLERAILYLDKLLKLSPTDYEAYFIRGTAYSNMMKHEAAIKDYDMAIKYKPHYMEAYANRGVAIINAMPMEEKGARADCLERPCKDLRKAQAMGDKTVEDMIFIYCSKCE